MKRFLQTALRRGGRGQPLRARRRRRTRPRFDAVGKAIVADADEIAANPRARSARLRVARRTDAPAAPGRSAPRSACRRSTEARRELMRSLLYVWPR